NKPLARLALAGQAFLQIAPKASLWKPFWGEGFPSSFLKFKKGRIWEVFSQVGQKTDNGRQPTCRASFSDLRSVARLYNIVNCI
ncbi:MAG: hypothetical protein L3J67_10845, partial [Hyphomicrobiaceae bacterium]|nr:hypothetical protein [Hyphomicrobiaceae bacterium]